MEVVTNATTKSASLMESAGVGAARRSSPRAIFAAHPCLLETTVREPLTQSMRCLDLLTRKNKLRLRSNLRHLRQFLSQRPRPRLRNLNRSQNCHAMSSAQWTAAMAWRASTMGIASAAVVQSLSEMVTAQVRLIRNAACLLSTVICAPLRSMSLHLPHRSLLSRN